MHQYVSLLLPGKRQLTNRNTVFGRTSHRLQNPSAEPESGNSDCALFCGIQSLTGCGWMLVNLYSSALHLREEANLPTVSMWWSVGRSARHMALKVAAWETAAPHSGVFAVRLSSRKRRSSPDNLRAARPLVTSLWRMACVCLEDLPWRHGWCWYPSSDVVGQGEADKELQKWRNCLVLLSASWQSFIYETS